MKKPFVVGIAGCTQSGKSTFTAELENALQSVKVKAFHMDDYFGFNENLPVAKAPVTRKAYNDFNQPASVNFPQLRLDLKNEIERNEVDVIIVEGTMILYDEEIFAALDLKLYVEISADERAVRYIELYSQYHGYDFIRNSYLDLVRYRMAEYVEPTKWRADIILNGSMKSEQAIEMVKTYLLTRISKGDRNAT